MLILMLLIMTGYFCSNNPQAKHYELDINRLPKKLRLSFNQPAKDSAIMNQDKQDESSDQCPCGYFIDDLPRRIWNGLPSTLQENPWHVSVHTYEYIVRNGIITYNSSHYICGGTIITLRHVLTAYHCVNENYDHGIFDKIFFITYASEWKYNSKEWNTKTILVKKIDPHPKYKQFGPYDLAIFTLDRKMDLSLGAFPICLPPPEERFENQVLKIIGFGFLDVNDEYVKGIAEASVVSLSPEVCKKRYETVAFNPEGFLCAASNKTSACKGESGGSLTWTDTTNMRTYIVGVTSMGVGKFCKDNEPEEYPGLYARVNSELAWIKSIVGKDLCEI